MNARSELEQRLRQGHHSVHELAEALGLPIRSVTDHADHLKRSLAHRNGRLLIHPARCRRCGFTFTHARLTRPGRCPRCRSTWIEPPRLEIVQRQ